MEKSFFQKFSPADFHVKKNIAHVYYGSIEKYLAKTEYFFSILDRDEKQKANTFKFEKDKNLYIISHGILREALSAYTGINTWDVSFSKNNFGKPSLSNKGYQIEFNLSHSGKHFAFAISKQDIIGIDIEELNVDFDFTQIVNDHFSADEKKQIENAPDKHKAFFSLWSQKEAYLKMKGVGLNEPVDLNSAKKSTHLRTFEQGIIILSVCTTKNLVVEFNAI